MTTPWDAITPGQEQDALGGITKMLTGSQMLKDEPGVVYALAQQKAHPADAGAIDQFMQGLDAEKQVRIAQAAGTKITLTPQQKVLLDGMNIDYSTVDFTQSNAAGDTAANLPVGTQVKRDANGNPVLDSNGNVQTESTPKPYKAKGIGRFFHAVNNDIIKPVNRDVVKPAYSDVVKPVGNALNMGWNVVDQTIGAAGHYVEKETKDLGVVGDMLPGLGDIQLFKQIWNAASGKSVGRLAPNFTAALKDAQQGGIAEAGQQPYQIDQMKAAGYDPSNLFSILAYRAQGKEHGDLSPLMTQWDQKFPKGNGGFTGQQAVGEAEKFLANPKAYTNGIVSDSTLTPEQIKEKLAFVSSPDFTELTRRVSASTETSGNLFASDMGLDPVKHPNEFALASGGLDLVTALALDPTMVLGKYVRVAKFAQVGIDTVADSRTAVRGLAEAADAAKPLTREELAASGTKGPGAVLAKAADVREAGGITGALGRVLRPSSNALGRGWQRAIDLGDQIREANATGDKAREAALTAQFNNELPALAPILPDIIGKNALLGWRQGAEKAEPILGESDGIRSLDDAVSYLANKVGMIRIMNGRAALESSYMPGSLSAFGLRKMRGIGAAWMTQQSAERQLGAEQKVLDAAAKNATLRDSLIAKGDLVDPAKARSIISESDLAKMEAHADDAVNAFTGDVIQSPTETAGAASGLKSAERGQLELTAQGSGNVARNLRATGSPLGSNALGWLSPRAIAARTRLGAQRLSTFLPRTLELDIEDPRSSETVYRMAMTYLNRGDARMTQAAYNAGSGAERKAIVGGLMDQVGHAAGLNKTETGRNLMERWKTQSQTYSSVGDEVTLDGENLALHAGQIKTKWTLPAFREIQKASQKIGLWEATTGRALTSNMADTLMGQWKLGALFKPSTWTRNMLEGWLKMSLDGNFGDALKARALLTIKNKELWERGFAKGAKADFDTAMAAGDLGEAEKIAKASSLSGDKLGRTKMSTAMADFAPFALTGKAYRELFHSAISDQELYGLEVLQRTKGLSGALDGYHQSILEDAMGLRHAALDATDNAKMGYGSASLRSAVQRGFATAAKARGEGSVVKYSDQLTDGTVGASRYVNALAMRINSTPDVARAVLDVLEKPTEYDVQHVVMMLEDPRVQSKIGLTSFGKVYWPDGPEAAAARARTPEQVEAGKVDFAQKVINDYKYLLTGRNEKYQQGLANEIRRTGRAPDEGWIEKNLKNDNRPHSVSAPEVMAMPNGGAKGIVSALQDVQGAGFEYLVERPLLRTTTSPAFLAHYSRAYKSLNPAIDRLVQDFGIEREAAENMAAETSVRNAWVKMESQIDDPGQKTQFDLIARNMFPFSRATQAMIRRWGGSLWQDPFKARKMMLAYEGAVHTGLVYDNAYGEPTFTYPGSGVLNGVLRNTLGHLPGFTNMFQFPIAGNMTGQVLMSVPGADNPFRMSMGPMISIPMREIFKLFPDHLSMLNEIDSAINGPIGVGQTWGQLTPAVVKKFYTAMDTNSRNSALASAMQGAIANLAAAGLIPPPSAPQTEIDAFIQRVKQQTRSQLFLRAAFGLVVPASPTSPTEGTSGSQADYAFKVMGIGQLSDEYKVILNDVKGDTARANAIFTALHPDKTVYEVPKSQATASKAYLPATAQALDWMAKNASFISKYKRVAAYFLPVGDANQPFDSQAYRTQIELGLRQRKTPGEFYNDFRIRGAEAVYYPSAKEFDQRIAAAKAAGDTQAQAQWTQAKSTWETEFKGLNPLFGAKLEQFGNARAAAESQLGDLRAMVKSGSAPDGQGQLLSQLVGAYDGLTAFVQQYKGSDTATADIHHQAYQMFNNWVTENIAGSPLLDLYQGVFRAIDTNLVNLAPVTNTATTGG